MKSSLAGVALWEACTIKAWSNRAGKQRLPCTQLRCFQGLRKGVHDAVASAFISDDNNGLICFLWHLEIECAISESPYILTILVLKVRQGVL